MMGRTEIDHSLAMIARAKTRLTYQRKVVEKLRAGTEPCFADLARHILKTMEAKLALLLKRHDVLVAATNADVARQRDGVREDP